MVTVVLYIFCLLFYLEKKEKNLLFLQSTSIGTLISFKQIWVNMNILTRNKHPRHCPAQTDGKSLAEVSATSVGDAGSVYLGSEKY